MIPTYNDFIQAYSNGNIDGCKDTGIYLLTTVLKCYHQASPAYKNISKLLHELESLSRNDNIVYIQQLLDKVKCTLYSHNVY